MYRSPTVARLAGAAGLPVFLAGWGLFTLLVRGEVTVRTWAFALALTIPLSGVLLALSRSRPAWGLEPEHAVGLLGGAIVTATGYVGVGLVANDVLEVFAGVGPLTLVAVAVPFAACGGLLAFLDARYVDRPRSVAVLEFAYLEDPNDDA